MKKRKLTKRTNKNWKKIIKSCLYKSAHTDRWGCLNSKGKLFRIATLDNIYIPMNVIKTMENKGYIVLDTSKGSTDFYRYIPKKERKLIIKH